MVLCSFVLCPLYLVLFNWSLVLVPEGQDVYSRADPIRSAPEVMNSPSSNRLLSLDAFRGLTVAGMVLVNNPGTWNFIYWPLEHAEWNGWTPTDLIFPFFLFIVGVSITLAFARRAQAGGSKRDLYLKVIKRTLIIFGLGLFLNGFPFFQLATIRIPGVLQRIAVCYLFASLIFLSTRIRTQAIIAVTLLIAYWLVMTHVAAPGFAAGDEAHVFDKFFRGRVEGVRGVGLGLAICKAIVERHQGTIIASNGPNGGALVRFELPVGGVPPEMTATSESRTS